MNISSSFDEHAKRQSIHIETEASAPITRPLLVVIV